MSASKSRSAAPATNTVIRNIPSTENSVSICTTTYGALRCVLPMPPPMVTWSELAAENAIAPNASAISQNSGLLSC